MCVCVCVCEETPQVVGRGRRRKLNRKNCVFKTPSRTEISPFLSTNASKHARSARERFDSREKRTHSPSASMVFDARNFVKKNNYARADSDSVSLTLNVLKYVVAFFGPFWRKPRVNMSLSCHVSLCLSLSLSLFLY